MSLRAATLRCGRGAVVTVALVLTLSGACATCAPALARQREPTPPRATVLKVQLLFGELGYPLGRERAGHFGVRTRGALTYFQRKYGLPVTGYPDRRTVLAMQSLASSLRGAAAAQAPPHDIVERSVGDHVPILTIAVALACVLALLALVAQRRSHSSQDSASADDTTSVSADS
jgi:hypothetical protein